MDLTCTELESDESESDESERIELPSEIWESIVYLLDYDSLDNFIEVYEKFRDELNWSIVYKYRFGEYKQVGYSEYYMLISIVKFKSIIKHNRKK